MKVSIIIPTYNRLGQLKRVLGGLENQTYPLHEFEVIVVSDGSMDGTDAYLRAANPPFHLRAIFQPNQGVAVARNLGVAHAVGEIVLFIDDDVFPLPALIEEHVRSHAIYGDCAVIIGPMLAPPGFELSPWARWEADRLAEQYRDMSAGRWAPTARQFYTGNASIARHHLLDCGGFDPAFRRAEDIELAYRLAERGLKFFFNPRAAGHHYAERSFASWLAIPYAYGCNNVSFSRRKGQTWLLSRVYMEFSTRHPFIRGLTRLCLDRPVLSAAVIAALVRAMQTSNGLKLNKLAELTCSGIFNLRYYQGIADGLGGRKAFFSGIDARQSTS